MKARAHRPGRTAPRGARAGLTLLELLLVMFILALILGGGLGFFAALDLGKRQATGAVRNVLRSAQNTAIARGAPARVRIDAAAGRLWPEALLVVGTYHFEDKQLSGYGPDGVADPELFTRDGWIGAGLRPIALPRGTAEIPIHLDTAFDLTLGFSVECAIRWETGASGGRILAIGEHEPPTLALELGQGGRLRARFRTRMGEGVESKAGGQVILESDPGLVAPERWTRVRMRYDRETFALLVDGALVESVAEASPVWKVEGPLVLCDRSRPFPGTLDGLVIAALVAEEAVALPERTRFAAGVPERIEFEAGGALNRRVHPDPPRIFLEHEDGSRELVTVGFYGTVE